MGLSTLIHMATKLPLLRSVRPMMCWVQSKRLGGLIRAYYRSNQSTEIREILQFLESNPRVRLPLDTMPPYDYVREHRAEDVEVQTDDSNGYSYVVCKGNRIYFPREYSSEVIRKAVVTAYTEQDRRSPHVYLSDTFGVDEGDSAVLAGASDGIFCLSIVDRLSKVYLFEPDTRWHEPLSLTTGPWRGKVEIVPRFLGAADTDNMVRLDTFFRDRPPIQYLQADVEGGERDLLCGAENTLRQNRKMRLSICCYHKHEDASELAEMLRRFGYDVGYSHGYFIMGLREPYLRRGVIYASRRAD
ncbi:MAG: FkbM family methyltransferase [Bacillota bacterium]